MRKKVIGVMGPGISAKPADLDHAFELGKLIAQEEWILLTGGEKEGVMDAVSRGAKSEGGMTVGVIPAKDNETTSAAVDIAIVTGIDNAANNVNVLSSDVIIGCGTAAGTVSELALALKAQREIVLLTNSQSSKDLFKELDPRHVHIAENPTHAIEICKSILDRNAITTR